VYLDGAYLPVHATGERGGHLISFARVAADGRAVLAVTGRLFQKLGASSRLPVKAETWSHTALEIPDAIRATRFRDLLTGSTIELSPRGSRVLKVADLFSTLPMALLEA
jgi:(1->4)-alpha-D-glucan 1-alpha-D-glucosylmutase